MSAHTPGPWVVDDDFAEPEVMAGEVFVATAHAGQPDDTWTDRPQAMANAHLIAAAPELLAALKEAVANHARESSACACLQCLRFRAAIAKAEGKS